MGHSESSLPVLTPPLHSSTLRSGPKLALAVKLQAKLSQHMAGLPAAQVEHAQLHLLHQLQCLETAARQDDGAALLQCLSKLHPQAAALAGPQRAAIFGMISPQHSQVVQEAAAALLLDSIAAEGSLEAVALAPALFSQLALPSDQRLRVVARCRSLLAAMPAAQRTPGWVQCVQVRGGGMLGTRGALFASKTGKTVCACCPPLCSGWRCMPGTPAAKRHSQLAPESRQPR